jgi:transmembrane sensor
MVGPRIKELIQKEIEGRISEQEKVELQQWVGASATNLSWYRLWVSDENAVVNRILREKAATKKAIVFQRLFPSVQKASKILLFQRRFSFNAAASFIVIATTLGGIFYFRNHKSDIPASASIADRYKNDVLPPKNAAYLTLADGKKIDLDGSVSPQNNIRQGDAIVKIDAGQLNYQTQTLSRKYQNPDGKPVDIVYNTVSVPRGGEYQVTLPDNSKVWINDETTLRFPTSFTSTRTIYLSGEAYFEITPNSSLPFQVITDDSTQVKVLGTSMSVSAYPGDPVKAVLITGAIKVMNGNNDSKILSPGELITSNKGLFSVEKDEEKVADAVAWKSGKFRWGGNGTDIYTIMKEIERWYDVEVVFQKEVKHEPFVAKVSKDVPLSHLLKDLELTQQVHFRIEGKRITVMP